MLRSIIGFPGRIWSAIPLGVQPHVRRFGWSGVLVVFVVVMMMIGFNPVTVFTGQVSPPPPPTSLDPLGVEEPTEVQKIAYINRSFEEMHRIWVNLFYANGLTYLHPQMNILSPGATEACGARRAGIGTFYCLDSMTIYVDLDDFDTVRDSFGESGERAYLYLMSYLYAQHVQGRLHVFEQFEELKKTGDNEAVARREREIGMQAHCYVGMWAAVQVHPRDSVEGAIAAPLNLILRASAQLNSSVQFVPKTLMQPSVTERVRWFEAAHDLPTPGTCSLRAVGGR